jgi:hypothetical protein
MNQKKLIKGRSLKQGIRMLRQVKGNLKRSKSEIVARLEPNQINFDGALFSLKH